MTNRCRGRVRAPRQPNAALDYLHERATSHNDVVGPRAIRPELSTWDGSRPPCASFPPRLPPLSGLGERGTASTRCMAAVPTLRASI